MGNKSKVESPLISTPIPRPLPGLGRAVTNSALRRCMFSVIFAVIVNGCHKEFQFRSLILSFISQNVFVLLCQAFNGDSRQGIFYMVAPDI